MFYDSKRLNKEVIVFHTDLGGSYPIEPGTMFRVGPCIFAMISRDHNSITCIKIERKA